MFGLTSLGTVHTAISLIAVATGFVALLRDRGIAWQNALGKTYVITTVLTCLTGFGIFQHGGFGKPHALGVDDISAPPLLPGGKSCSSCGSLYPSTNGSFLPSAEGER